jgi:hypothetical protein
LIQGFFDPNAGWPQPKVAVTLQLQGLPLVDTVPAFEVDFLLDTGAGVSTLSPTAARDVGQIPAFLLMQPQMWVRRDHIGIGGTSEFYCVECSYTFTDVDGETRTVLGEIDIARPTVATAYLPSVLGWDVLQHFAIRLDWSQRLVELA